jgi:hypothetical protein
MWDSVGHCDYLSANKLQQHFPRLSQTFSPLLCTDLGQLNHSDYQHIKARVNQKYMK